MEELFPSVIHGQGSKKLKSLNVLRSIDGQESDWASDAENHDVLYECAPCASYVLRTFRRELPSYQSMEELSDLPEEEDKKETTANVPEVFARTIRGAGFMGTRLILFSWTKKII